MLAHFAPSSAVIVAMLIVCLVMVLAFEASNGFRDSSNAVATVIYTHTLQPVPAVVWSGIMNLVGVLVGGISVAYALGDILPPAPGGNQKIDRPEWVVNHSKANVPASELPFASSPGDQTQTAISPGSTATTPPPTPLLAGSPTR